MNQEEIEHRAQKLLEQSKKLYEMKPYFEKHQQSNEQCAEILAEVVAELILIEEELKALHEMRLDAERRARRERRTS